MSSPQKYGIVRAIAFVLKLLAWVALAAGILVALTSFGLPAIVRPVGLVIGPLVGIVWFVQLYAFGSILSLLMDIEENTHALATQPTAGAASVDLA